MKTLLNNPEAVEKMRVAGKLAADVLVMLDEYVKEGVTTGALDLSLIHISEPTRPY